MSTFLEQRKQGYKKISEHEYLNTADRIVGSFLIYAVISLSLIIDVKFLCPKEQNIFIT
jgi:hypothetical protein